MPVSFVCLYTFCFVLASLSGAIAGEIFGKRPTQIVYGSGAEVRSAISAVPLFMWAACFLPVTLCIYLLNLPVMVGIWPDGSSFSDIGFACVCWAMGFITISDLRTRYLPDFVVIPLMLGGFLRDGTNPYVVASSFYAAGFVIAMRLAVGAAVLAYLTARRSEEGRRVYLMVSDGDWMLACATAAWSGLLGLPDLLICTVAPLLLTLMIAGAPIIGSPFSAFVKRVIVFFYTLEEAPDQRDHIPAGPPFVVGLVVYMLLTIIHQGAYLPTPYILSVIHTMSGKL